VSFRICAIASLKPRLPRHAGRCLSVVEIFKFMKLEIGAATGRQRVATLRDPILRLLFLSGFQGHPHWSRLASVVRHGRRTKFRLNWAQEALFNEMHHLNVILKARQLGFTTFMQPFMLDACVFNSNIRAGTIAHCLEDAQ
jgi:hypothetical protein